MNNFYPKTKWVDGQHITITPGMQERVRNRLDAFFQDMQWLIDIRTTAEMDWYNRKIWQPLLWKLLGCGAITTVILCLLL